MMLPVRVFLLLLLALEWWDDPLHGASLFSQRMASQHALSSAHGDLGMLARSCLHGNDGTGSAAAHASLPLDPKCLEKHLEQHVGLILPGSTLYVLKVLRC